MSVFEYINIYIYLDIYERTYIIYVCIYIYIYLHERV